MIRPIKVIPLEDYMLYLEFSNNDKRIFDLKPYFDLPFYKPLLDVEQFRKVYVAEYTIEWANGKDISPHELYDNSIGVDVMVDGI